MNLIRFRNGPKKVTLIDGTIIENDLEEKIFVLEYVGFVRKAPYDNQFLFEVPKRLAGPSYMCSCGSAAVFVGSKAYGHLGSAEGLMLVCHAHTSNNKHADGSK